MTNLPPIWLLDIDGVINAMGLKPPTNVWPARDWTTRKVYQHADRQVYDIQIARPVAQFIRDIHHQGRAEIRWHTTWQRSANRVGRTFGLPTLPIEDAPEYATWDHAKAKGWWKLPAVQRAALEGRPIIWTDDDIPYYPHRDEYQQLAATIPLLAIAPDHITGLTRRQLARIDQFLTDHAKTAADA